MTENEFIHIVPQLRQITLQISQGYGVGSEEAEDIAQDAMLKLWAIKDDIQSALMPKVRWVASPSIFASTSFASGR